MRYCRHIAGFTLFELMLSIVLGLLILSGAFTLLVAAMKNSQAAMQAQQQQNTIMSVMQLLANDVASAGAFGCAGACRQASSLQGLRGDHAAITLAYQGQPQAVLLRVSDDGLHISVSGSDRFSPNEVLIIAQPDVLAEAAVRAEGQYRGEERITLTAPLRLKNPVGARVGRAVNHHYFYDAARKKLQLTLNQGEPLTLLDGVTAFSLSYDIKTSAGVIEAQPGTNLAFDKVCGVKVVLTVEQQTWATYLPVLSHCL